MVTYRLAVDIQGYSVDIQGYSVDIQVDSVDIQVDSVDIQVDFVDIQVDSGDIQVDLGGVCCPWLTRFRADLVVTMKLKQIILFKEMRRNIWPCCVLSVKTDRQVKMSLLITDDRVATIDAMCNQIKKNEHQILKIH